VVRPVPGFGAVLERAWMGETRKQPLICSEAAFFACSIPRVATANDGGVSNPNGKTGWEHRYDADVYGEVSNPERAW
jgi:hypothetical protein